MNRLIPLILFVITSCSNPQNSEQTTSRAAEQKETQRCFRRLAGTKLQDTTELSLTLLGDDVRGTFNHLPFEKDSRKGTLSGVIEDSVIVAKWYFLQEGMLDTMDVEFKLAGNGLLQKTYGVDQKTGKEVLTDTSTYSIKFTEINCKK